MATIDIQVTDYSLQEIYLRIEDDGGFIEDNYIKKGYFTTEVSGDFVIIYWHRKETERDRQVRILDYNLVSDPVVLSAIDFNNKIILLGGSVTWGSITGTLSNQTDLQDELDNLFAIAIAL